MLKLMAQPGELKIEVRCKATLVLIFRRLICINITEAHVRLRVRNGLFKVSDTLGTWREDYQTQSKLFVYKLPTLHGNFSDSCMTHTL